MDVKEVSEMKANPKARAQTAAIRENRDVTLRAAKRNVEDLANPPFKSPLVVFARFLRRFWPPVTGTDTGTSGTAVTATAPCLIGGRSRLLLRSADCLGG